MIIGSGPLNSKCMLKVISFTKGSYTQGHTSHASAEFNLLMLNASTYWRLLQLTDVRFKLLMFYRWHRPKNQALWCPRQLLTQFCCTNQHKVTHKYTWNKLNQLDAYCHVLLNVFSKMSHFLRQGDISMVLLLNLSKVYRLSVDSILITVKKQWKHLCLFKRNIAN